MAGVHQKIVISSRIISRRRLSATIRRPDIGSIRLGGRAMRKTMRDRNRWFSVVAMTCLSGFALSGCTGRSRDLSASLSESAGREAIEAERQVAERKKQESSGAKSKELLASKSRTTAPKSERSSTKTASTPSKPTAKSAELASKTSQTVREELPDLDDTDLATADWAGDYLDRRVQTVSGDEEGVVETAEPLLSRRRQPTATELFDEDEATVKVQRSTSQSQPPEERAGRASYGETTEHPWSQKAPTTTRSATSDPARRVAAKTPTVKPSPPDEARQLEAKARVQALLTQSKSLINKGEHRSAFRVAQLAQRIADSENLFFGPGEEQPADIVRSVLMKVRSEEAQVAKTGENSAGRTSKTSQSVSHTKGGKSRSANPLTNQAGDWSYDDEWSNEQAHLTPVAEVPEEADSAELTNNPWASTKKKLPADHVTQNSPESSSRGSRYNEQFPKSRPVWRNSANEPQTLSSSDEEYASGFATAKEGRLAADNNVQTKFNDSPTRDGLTEANSHSTRHEFARDPSPKKTVDRVPTLLNSERDRETSEPLAMAQDWRTQDLNQVATSRQPLLVAPLPPAEPLIPSVLAVPGEDIFAVEVQEPLPNQPESKLWMILAAAAGAFAMLFVRRRPAPVVRSGNDSR